MLFFVEIINRFCCSFFLQEKQEWWWIYVTDRRKTELITPPQQIFNLKDEEKVKFLFNILVGENRDLLNFCSIFGRP